MKGKLDALSDAIIAIAITVLVLEIIHQHRWRVCGSSQRKSFYLRKVLS